MPAPPHLANSDGHDAMAASVVPNPALSVKPAAIAPPLSIEASQEASVI